MQIDASSILCNSTPSDRSDCSDGLLVFTQLIPPPLPTILLLLQVSFSALACKQCQVKAHALLVCQTAAAAAYKACLQLIYVMHAVKR